MSKAHDVVAKLGESDGVRGEINDGLMGYVIPRLRLDDPQVDSINLFKLMRSFDFTKQNEVELAKLHKKAEAEIQELAEAVQVALEAFGHRYANQLKNYVSGLHIEKH